MAMIIIFNRQAGLVQKAQFKAILWFVVNCCTCFSTNLPIKKLGDFDVKL